MSTPTSKMIKINESKNLEYISLGGNDGDDNTDISLCDEDLMDSNVDFSSIQDQDDANASISPLSRYSSIQSNQQFSLKSLNSCETDLSNNRTVNSNSQEYKQNEDRLDMDNIDDTLDAYNLLNTDEINTKILALKYHNISENKQNELQILKKLEFYLLKFKWTAKVLEADKASYSMNTILVCDNSCESKLNLTNLVVRLKLKLDKYFTLNSELMNEFVNDYLLKLIHLILNKHKCSPMSNELSLILIRNFFKQLQINDKNLFENDEEINKEHVMNVLRTNIDIHLNEAHSCNSLVSLNNLTNKDINGHELTVEHDQPFNKNQKYLENNISVDEKAYDVDQSNELDNSDLCKSNPQLDNAYEYSENIIRTKSLDKNFDDETSIDGVDNLEPNKKTNSKTEKNSFYNENNDKLFTTNYLPVIPESENHHRESDNVSNKKIDNTYEYRINDDHNSINLPQSVSSPSLEKSNLLNNSSHHEILRSSQDTIINDQAYYLTENLKLPTAANAHESSTILKAINKRKLQLSCPICSSCVVNMSDHLVKKHSIKDRNERKYLMDRVRKSYINMGPSSSTVPSNSLSTLSPRFLNPTNSASSQLPESILAASLTMLQNQKLHPNTHASQQLRQLVQINNTTNSILNTNETIHQNLQILDQLNNQNQLSYNNNSIFASINSAKKLNDNLKSPNNSNTNSSVSQITTPNKHQSSVLVNVSQNSNRKFIKCPICLDDNKFFVNISDHLIKIHHLVTSEMRKPILKQIKENSTLSINKSQIDLIYSSNLNKKLKFDPQNTNKQLLSSNQEDKNQQNQHTFQQPIHNQHPSQQQTRQNLNRIEESQVSQELQEEEQNIKSESKLQNSNRPRTANLPNSNSTCQSNLLVTDEDIADYSDLISLNYEPFLPFSHSSRHTSQYENINFDFESYKLYTPNNIDESDNIDINDSQENSSFVNSNNNICDHSNPTQTNIKDEKFLNYETKKRKSKQDELILPNSSKLCKKLKQPSKGINNQSDEITSSDPNEIFFTDESPNQHNQQTNNIPEDNKNISLSSPNAARHSSNQFEDLYSHQSQSYPSKSTISQRESPTSLSSSLFTSSCKEAMSQTQKVATNSLSDTNMASSSEYKINQMLSKLTELEDNLNNTVKGFNAFKDNLLDQFQYFSNQFESNLEEISSVKKQLLTINETSVANDADFNKIE